MTKTNINRSIRPLTVNGVRLYIYESPSLGEWIYNRTTKRVHAGDIEMGRCFSKRDFVDYIYTERKRIERIRADISIYVGTECPVMGERKMWEWAMDLIKSKGI